MTDELPWKYCVGMQQLLTTFSSILHLAITCTVNISNHSEAMKSRDSLKWNNRHVFAIFSLCFSKDKAGGTLDRLFILAMASGPWGIEQVMQDVFQVANYTLRKIEIYWSEVSSTAEQVQLKLSAKQLGVTAVSSLFQLGGPRGTCHEQKIK